MRAITGQQGELDQLLHHIHHTLVVRGRLHPARIIKLCKGLMTDDWLGMVIMRIQRPSTRI